MGIQQPSVSLNSDSLDTKGGVLSFKGIVRFSTSICSGLNAQAKRRRAEGLSRGGRAVSGKLCRWCHVWRTPGIGPWFCAGRFRECDPCCSVATKRLPTGAPSFPGNFIWVSMCPYGAGKARSEGREGIRSIDSLNRLGTGSLFSCTCHQRIIPRVMTGVSISHQL